MTPLIQQYYQIKEKYKGKILFFRMGDFFEMFDEDAETAAPILNIALTFRNKKAGMKVKMCGLPHHSISGPISKLLDHGFHVAICDQLEGQVDKSGLVKRAVTRVLSPGMVYDLDSLEGSSPNYLCAFDKQNISFLDISTGSAFYYDFLGRVEFFKLLEQFQPREIVLTELQKNKVLIPPEFNVSLFDKMIPSSFSVSSLLSSKRRDSRSRRLDDSGGNNEIDWNEDSQTDADEDRQKRSSNNLSYPKSVQRLLYYVYTMQGEESLRTISSFEKRSLKKEMYYSSQLYSHLEIFKNYEGGQKDTLFSVINRTKTPHGARLLKQRLQSPLIDKEEIEKRWSRLDWWLSHLDCLDQVRAALKPQGDGERKLAKLVQPQVSGRDLLALSETLIAGLKVEEYLQKNNSPWLAKAEDLKTAGLLVDKIKHIISIDCPANLKEAGVINSGVNPQLDEWMSLAKSSQALVLKMEQKEKEELKIPSLKIRYNGVFGYYIEVRKIHGSKVPSHYKRKQTLVQAERYMTDELYQLEQKILSAKSKQIEWEQEIFKDLLDEVLEELSTLNALFELWSEVDFYSSLAYLSLENRYVRPKLGNRFQLKGSRHPVLDQKSFHEFVPNSIDLNSDQTIILTGPNMAGKSTLMRQFALTILMAQVGCFVPADSAELPVFHKMFTRMGASDFLSKGLSTFMVEMKETAEILEQADSKSFILLDELGRGTATFDGMSLAQSIIEFLTVEKKALVFSATHYQELTKLAEKHPSILNFSMQIRESEGQIHFLYLLKENPADKSYGIPVARLAGLPDSVLKRAEELLSIHEDFSQEKENRLKKHKTLTPDSSNLSDINQKVLKCYENEQEKKIFSNDEEKMDSQFENLKKEIQNYPLIHRSPIDALNQIKKWQDQISNQLKDEGSDSLKGFKTKPFNESEQDDFKDRLN